MNNSIVNFLLSLDAALILALVGWVGYLTRRISTLEVHVAEQYASKGEIRHVNETVVNIQQTVSEILKVLHELKGRMDGLRNERA